jgi:uncharacterized repeat protein (TIGR03803 family)
VLYNFCSNEVNGQCLDGAQPVSQLAFDTKGNLYGTTTAGGSGHVGAGTVFELSPGVSGWTETVLYSFCSVGQGNFCPDGSAPQAGVTLDKLGNLYGTTEFGGVPKAEGGGVVFKLTPASNGQWNESLLFTSRPPFDIANPLGSVSLDPLGNVYGTLSQRGWGSVFRLGSKGAAAFFFNGKNGSSPAAGVLIDSNRGALYGTPREERITLAPSIKSWHLNKRAICTVSVRSRVALTG